MIPSSRSEGEKLMYSHLVGAGGIGSGIFFNLQNDYT